jgi:hypothetical protein
MMRTFRRTLRQWKREFQSVWSRFTAFHRIVIGILLAMGVVFGARSRALDPLDRELSALRQELADKGIPAHLPLPAADGVVLEERVRAENLAQSLEHRARELERAEAAARFRLGAGHADATSALLALAGRHSLHVRRNVAVDPPPGGPVPMAASSYELAGRFPAIHRFLDDLRSEPLLWELRDVSIGLLNGRDAFGGLASPTLLLRFTLVQHLYGGGPA